MTLRDVLKETGKMNENIVIMYRITIPSEITEAVGYEDTLFGYCEWKNGELTPLDGDSYSLDDEILYYKLFETESDEEMLSVTVEGVPMFNPDGSINMD